MQIYNITYEKDSVMKMTECAKCSLSNIKNKIQNDGGEIISISLRKKNKKK